MKKFWKFTVAALVLLALMLQLGPVSLAAGEKITTTATGYTYAEDVEYLIVKNTVVNWGARGEDCTFLTTYAVDYYVGSYSWQTLSALPGGTGTSDAYNSQLYEALQDMMQTKHTKIQGYQDTRPYYCYTDCVSNDYSKVSTFYSGKPVNGTWDGKTYNREHVWPNSKCLNTNKTNDSADIMMLRATTSSENSSRGNKAYGESGGYCDPGESVRGDCARMVLYGYVRWGNTGHMWGSSGVMENLEILLKWMAEDPVDTWEMARNDSVQSITGVRNVFVDYPELAWLLFGQQMPEDALTPSGNGTAGMICAHSNTQVKNQKDATCGQSGYTGDAYCKDCGKKLSSGKKISATGEHDFVDGTTAPGGVSMIRYCQVCGYEETVELPPCEHENTELSGAVEATCGTEGHTGRLLCRDCGCFVDLGEVLPATGQHAYGEWTVIREATGTQTGEKSRQCGQCGFAEVEQIPVCAHENTQLRDQRDANCSTAGYSGDAYCADCGDLVEEGSVIRATGKHTYGQWQESESGSARSCGVCGQTETIRYDQDGDPDHSWIWIVVTVAAAGVITVVIIVIVRKRKK